MPFNSSSSSSTSTSNNKSKNNNRGRFLQLASSSLRRSQKTSKTQTAGGGGGDHVASSVGRGGTSSKSSPSLSSSNNNNNNNIRGTGDFRRLSPLKEISTSRPSSSTSSSSKTNKNNDSINEHKHSHQNQQQQQQQQQQQHKSSMPVGANNNQFPETGFSQSELYDLEESFKLFDSNGEGSVQVGELRTILNVLQQEQSANANTNTSYCYPHLQTLLYQLSELSDEDNLTVDDYIQLMSSTTITNNEEAGEDTTNNSHFARVFRLFDIDGKGYITVDDLERVAIELGEHDMTIEEIHEMIDRAKCKNNGVDITTTANNNNHDDNGRVYVDDFTRMMTTSLFSHTIGTVNGGVEGEQ